MGTSVFPSLIGLGFDVGRSPIWSNQVDESASGAETAVAYWSYPRRLYSLTFDILRSDSVNAELQSLEGFFNLRKGNFDSFLFTDPDDNSVTAQQVGTGDAATLTFQLVRAYGGFTEPIFAPNTISNVYLDGVNQASGWSVSTWGSATPGILTFVSAPGSGVVITVTYSYYFPCRFVDPQMDFQKFMYQMWKNQSVKFKSIKLGS